MFWHLVALLSSLVFFWVAVAARLIVAVAGVLRAFGTRESSE
ncbi:hypothetical protein [Mycobacterium gastri]|nr:hypothetical protein [Mycobacterium gastri]ETW25469.1 hypothetical protein MGAST_02520 [Mycobacterium gastri 'Wayne']